MIRLLLDANVSPKCAVQLAEAYGFDAVSVYDVLAADAADEAIAEYAAARRPVVITVDVGFGVLFYRFERGRLGVIVLRIAHQMAASTNRSLDRLFKSPESASPAFTRSFIIVDDRRIRISTVTMLR